MVERFPELNQKSLKKAQPSGIFCCDCYRVGIPRGCDWAHGFSILTIPLKSYCLKWSNRYRFALMAQQTFRHISYHLLSHRWHKGGPKSVSRALIRTEMQPRIPVLLRPTSARQEMWQFTGPVLTDVAELSSAIASTSNVVLNQIRLHKQSLLIAAWNIPLI